MSPPCPSIRQHDAQMNFYGTKLATCSSDRALRIFDVSLGQQKLVTTLVGLVSPVVHSELTSRIHKVPVLHECHGPAPVNHSPRLFHPLTPPPTPTNSS